MSLSKRRSAPRPQSGRAAERIDLGDHDALLRGPMRLANGRSTRAGEPVRAGRSRCACIEALDPARPAETAGRALGSFVSTAAAAEADRPGAPSGLDRLPLRAKFQNAPYEAKCNLRLALNYGGRARQTTRTAASVARSPPTNCGKSPIMCVYMPFCLIDSSRPTSDACCTHAAHNSFSAVVLPPVPMGKGLHYTYSPIFDFLCSFLFPILDFERGQQTGGATPAGP